MSIVTPHVDSRRAGRAPARGRAPRDSDQQERKDGGGREEVPRAVLQVRHGDVLREQRGELKNQEPGGVQEQALEDGSRVRRPVLAGQHHQHRADTDAVDAEGEHQVGRAQYLHVESVGVVPPVVQRCRHDHRQRAPDADPGAERTAEAPERDPGGALAGAAGERGAEHQPAARQAGDHAAQIDGQVGRRPERIPADGPMPGDVPEDADEDARRRERDSPQGPGYDRGSDARRR